MDVAQLRQFCINKKGVTEHFPFDDVTLVFKVMGKMFALTSLEKWEQGVPNINLKCKPEKAIELRAAYIGVQPGWHANKKHWNTVAINASDVSDTLLQELIDHSYAMVVLGLTKKVQVILKNL